MPRLVPARWIAALRPDATRPMEPSADPSPETRRRVRVAAAIGSMGYAVFLAVELTRVLGGDTRERTVDLTHDVVGLALCVTLWLVASLPAVSARRVVQIALATEVALAALISYAVSWAGYLRTAHVASLTWVVPIIILFPLLIPTPPRVTLPVSILCALTMPGALWLLDARGMIQAQASDYIHSLVTGGVAVAIAVIAARTVHHARQQIAVARTIGSYELLEPLAAGGMGQVWKARHLMLARPAAVKLILPETLRGPHEARDAAIRRFTREAQITASLRSPHTVELFDFGSTADGALYYAMELLDGMTLEEFVYRFGPLEPRRVVHWLTQACHSLGEAHARDLIHRDIKPGNIFVCRYGRDADFVKVLDFGLGKPLAPDPGEPAVTQASVRLGTPGYMAPEQVFGLTTDPRADLYALGCVGWFLLAGRRPFESNNVGELLRQHALAEPPPIPSERHVPPALERLIQSCLAKDPGGRPVNADRLCDELDHVLDGERWAQDEARAWWQENVTDG